MRKGAAEGYGQGEGKAPEEVERGVQEGQLVVWFEIQVEGVHTGREIRGGEGVEVVALQEVVEEKGDGQEVCKEYDRKSLLRFRFSGQL